MKEMKRMSVNVLGVAKTFWKGEGDFTTELPEDGETYRLIYSGGEKNRRGVGMILRGNVAKSVLDYKLVSDRIMIVKLKADPAKHDAYTSICTY